MMIIENENHAVLSLSMDEKIKYFRVKAIDHEILNNIRGEVIRAIKHGGYQLVIVIGAPGIGKKTLRKQIVARVKEWLSDIVKKDPGRIPIATIDATPPFWGMFNWSDFLTRLLEGLFEPMIHLKKAPEDDEMTQLLLKSYGMKTPSKLLSACEKALKHRRPAAVIFDEAQHVVDLKNEHTVIGQLNILKALAERSQTLLVLLGTYKLASALQLNGELLRRSKVLHFRPYSKEVPEDVAEFKRILRTMQNALPVEETIKLEDYYEYLMLYSCGCVGLLKDWLERALILALDEGSKRLLLRHLKETASSKGEVRTIFREISKGLEDMTEFYTGKNAKKWHDEKTAVENKDGNKEKPQRKVGDRYPNREPGRYKAQDVQVGPEIDSRNMESPSTH